MRSIIKFLKREPRQIYLIFKADEGVISSIEKILVAIDKSFMLENYRKKYGRKILDNFWESYEKNQAYGFSLIKRRNIFKLKIKGKEGMLKKIMDKLVKYTKFSALSQKAKRRYEHLQI